MEIGSELLPPPCRGPLFAQDGPRGRNADPRGSDQIPLSTVPPAGPSLSTTTASMARVAHRGCGAFNRKRRAPAAASELQGQFTTTPPIKPGCQTWAANWQL